MLRTVAACLCLGVAALQAEGSARVQESRPDQMCGPDQGRICGRALDARSFEPVRSVGIVLTSLDGLVSRTTATDVSGWFVLANVPDGTYTLVASKVGYLPAGAGQRHYFDEAQPVEVRAGVTHDVALTLWPAAVIAGRVMDEFGAPLINARVRALRHALVGGRSQLIPVRPEASTDDLGEFRLFGLPPGRYYVEARAPAMVRTVSGLETGNAPVYHPGTLDIESAEALQLGIGETAHATMIAFRTPVYRVTGTVLDSSGTSVRGGTVRAGRLIGGLFTTVASASVSDDGSFVAARLSPGRYALSASVGAGDSLESGTAIVWVTGDVEGLMIALQRPARLSGRIVLDTPADGALRRSLLRVVAYPVGGGEPLGIDTGGRLRDDWTFDIAAPPGRVVVRILGLPGEWTLRTVSVGGVAVTDDGIDLGSGSRVPDVEVHLTNDGAEVRGVITDESGELAGGATVIIFADDPTRWGPLSGYLRVQTATPEGTFRFRGLLPGRYLLVARSDLSPELAAEPGMRPALVPDATPVDVAGDERLSLDVTLRR